MEDKYLVLDDTSTVVNIIVYDGVSEYNPGENLSVEVHPKELDGSYTYITIGSVRGADSSWTHPEPVVSE
jgi:hypothetical protein